LVYMINVYLKSQQMQSEYQDILWPGACIIKLFYGRNKLVP
jgi:hypothetical protein